MSEILNFGEMRSSDSKCEVLSVADATLEPVIRELCSLIRRHRLNYDQLGYVSKRARQRLELHPPRRPVPLPKALSQDELESFFNSIRKHGTAEHELLFRVAYATGARVSEMCNIRREHVDLGAATVRIEQGKGGKSRVVMLPASVLLTLRLHIQSNPNQAFLFETRRRSRFSVRWVQALAAKYGQLAGIEDMHPHRLRHSVLTRLAAGITLTDGRRVHGMSDAQLQVVSGHSQRRSLEVYSKLGLSHVREHYDALMQDEID